MRSSPFPEDMLRRLDLFGRYEVDPRTCGIDGSEIWPTCVAPFYPYSQEDRDGFLGNLHAAVADDHGGFATYGAARLVWELLGGEALRTAAAWPLIDAGIEFKAARGLSTAHFTGYEMQRIHERQHTKEI
ncbi:hypothetical protein [Dactylosporangium fulvum]|uniref:Uncharacterized protein n=1 Tax=Dactylosporangium fulvum TaxID=53359 RepID=A0ABY5W2B7_9ACTN|nr:hypothetical protein [Dactylosporangium fulvum]UWP83189.1 hypothetical protein Dfulv_02445 [Dactylosporangium fulvum]